VRAKAVIPFGVGEAFVHRVHILGAELARAQAGGRCGLPRHVGNMLCDCGRDQQIRLSCDQRPS